MLQRLLNEGQYPQANEALLPLGQVHFEFLDLIDGACVERRLVRVQCDFEVLHQCRQEHCLFDERELIAKTNNNKGKSSMRMANKQMEQLVSRIYQDRTFQAQSRTQGCVFLQIQYLRG